jgi:hypothetical protein
MTDTVEDCRYNHASVVEAPTTSLLLTARTSFVRGMTKAMLESTSKEGEENLCAPDIESLTTQTPQNLVVYEIYAISH